MGICKWIEGGEWGGRSWVMFDSNLIQRDLGFDRRLTRVSKHVKFDMIDTFDMDVKTCQTMSNVCQYVKTMFDRNGVESF